MRLSAGAVLAVLTAFAAFAACGGGPAQSPRVAQARAAARQAGLPVEVQNFVADAVGSARARYTVTYDLGGQAATVTQRPPQRRIDSGDQPFITSREGSFACRRDGGKWSCQKDAAPPPVAGAFSVDQFADAVGSLVS